MVRSTKMSPKSMIMGVTLAMWMLLAVVAPWQTLADSRSTAVAVGLSVWGWALWVIAAVALLVPSSISLTVLRIIAPVAVAVSAAATSTPGLFASVATIVIVASSLFVDVMVQGDAYGDERRFSLRTPVPQMMPAAVAWSLLVVPMLAGSLGMCAARWAWGAPLTAVGVVAMAIIPRRLHRLARRWLVLVPAGVVLHDHLVLGETLMVMRSRVAGIKVADGPNDAADLTGGVLGRRLNIELVDADKVVLSPITASLLGTSIALHIRTFACAPRRIDAALATLRR